MTEVPAVAVAGGNERRGKVVAARFDKFLKDATSVWATKRRRQFGIFPLRSRLISP
jgi:hypothetical protein